MKKILNLEPIEAETGEPNEYLDYFQFARPLSGITDLEWAQIRKIARDCHENNMYGKDQLKCAVEAYCRYVILTSLNDDLSQEYQGERGNSTIH